MNNDDRQRRRGVVRTAIVLALIALAFYLSSFFFLADR